MALGKKPASVATRLAVAQMAGLLIGVIAFAILPVFMPDLDQRLRWGIFLWYPTLGAVIAMVEVIDSEARYGVSLPWWLRGAMVGAWLNLVATLIAYDVMAAFLRSAFGPASVLASPFWFVAEGAAAGLLIGYLVMRFGGDGREIADD